MLCMSKKLLPFERKLTFLVQDLLKGTLSHHIEENSNKAQNVINTEQLQSAIITMQESFRKRYYNLRQEKHVIFPGLTGCAFGNVIF